MIHRSRMCPVAMALSLIPSIYAHVREGAHTHTHIYTHLVWCLTLVIPATHIKPRQEDASLHCIVNSRIALGAM